MKMGSAGLNNFFLLDQIKGHCPMYLKILSFGIPLNIYLSQFVRVYGKYIFSHFCDFQTLDP